MKHPESFASRLRDSMGKAHTGRSIAAALEVREETVSGWRNGKAPPDEPRLSALATILGVSPQWLRYGVEEPPAPDASHAPDTPLPEPPKLAGVNVTYTNSETLVAVRLAHQEYSARQNAESWDYSVKVVRLVLESIGRAFEGAGPISGAMSPSEVAEIEGALADNRRKEEQLAAERRQSSPEEVARTEQKAAGGDRH